MIVLRPRLEFGALSAIGTVRWLVVHTQAGNPASTAADVHAYHRSIGWAGIGYHYFIRSDGTVEMGRPEETQGAHARGLNANSLGICCAGHGDRSDFTPAQKAALGWLLRELRERYGLGRDRVIGHREVHTLAGAPAPGKSCPGDRVDMQEVRELSEVPQADPLDSIPRPEPTIVGAGDPPQVPEPQLEPISARGVSVHLHQYAEDAGIEPSAMCRAAGWARTAIRISRVIQPERIRPAIDLLDAVLAHAEDRCDRAA